MRPLHAFPAALACALAGCGIGISGAGDHPAVEDALLGSRSLPGATVTLRQVGDDLELRIDPPTAAASLELFAGADWSVAQPVTTAAGALGSWTASRRSEELLVRLRLGDGSVLETAPGDFVAR